MTASRPGWGVRTPPGLFFEHWARCTHTATMSRDIVVERFSAIHFRCRADFILEEMDALAFLKGAVIKRVLKKKAWRK